MHKCKIVRLFGIKYMIKYVILQENVVYLNMPKYFGRLDFTIINVI